MKGFTLDIEILCTKLRATALVTGISSHGKLEINLPLYTKLLIYYSSPAIMGLQPLMFAHSNCLNLWQIQSRFNSLFIVPDEIFIGEFDPQIGLNNESNKVLFGQLEQ